MKTFRLFGILIAVSGLLQAAAIKNVVFILVDDLGKHDMGVEGSTFYETPRIDDLAKRGMRFNNGYSTCQVCSPSRASIQLGTTTARHGITDWIGAASGLKWSRNDKVLPPEYTHALPAGEVTIAEALKEGGYTTFYAGKWHIGGEGSHPEDHGYDINKGGFHRGSPPGGFFSPYKNPKLTDGPEGESLTLRLAQETATFIEGHKDEPFFAFLAFYAVHAPIQTTSELRAKYTEKAKSLKGGRPEFIVDRTYPVRQVQNLPVYAGMMETLDDAVGIVLDALKENGLEETTAIIFTSDNGGVSSGDAFATSCLPFRGGKGRQWEGGLRAPYYISVPGLTQPGSSSDVLANGTDFYPTILELVGLALRPKQHLDGVSLVPALKGGSLPDRALFWHYPHYGNQGGEPSSVIRSGDWKLIHYHEDGRDELYNVSTDIGEQRDVIKSKPELADKLRKELDAYLAETNARMPTPDPRYNKEVAEKKAAGYRKTAKRFGVEGY